MSGDIKFLVDVMSMVYVDDEETDNGFQLDQDSVREIMDKEPMTAEEVREYMDRHYLTDLTSNGNKVGVEDNETNIVTGNREVKTMFCAGAVKANGESMPEEQAQDLFAKVVHNKLGLRIEPGSNFNA